MVEETITVPSTLKDDIQEVQYLLENCMSEDHGFATFTWSQWNSLPDREKRITFAKTSVLLLPSPDKRDHVLSELEWEKESFRTMLDMKMFRAVQGEDYFLSCNFRSCSSDLGMPVESDDAKIKKVAFDEFIDLMGSGTQMIMSDIPLCTSEVPVTNTIK